ncbi:Aspartic proteinase CDR1 [Linum grandiflorum]
MNISIGTPSVQILALADTGSDIIWTKCSAFPNKDILFTPKLSHTYKTLQCPSKAYVTGDDGVSTPLIYDPLRPSFFFVRLEAMSVGNVRIPFRGSTSEDQNILIDSGTLYSILPTEFCSQLLSEVGRQTVGKKRVADPSSSQFPLCYEAGPTDSINAPPVTMNFLGADVKLSQYHVFIQVSDTVMCFAFKPADNISVYGNLAQHNFLIGYDLHNNVVSFKPADCAHK